MKKDNFSLPTPQMLIKKAKEETIPVSLRVKESTLAVFNKMAEDAGIKVGSMINTWLDFYAQNYANSSDDVSKEVMVQYLKKNAEKLLKMDDEELIYHICRDGIPDPMVYDWEFVNYVADAYNDKDEDFDANIYTSFWNNNWQYDFDLSINAGKKCEYSDDSGGFYITVKREQWPLVAALIFDYMKKYKKEHPDARFAITKNDIKKIFAAVNGIEDKKTLANGITKTLVEFVEAQDE